MDGVHTPLLDGYHETKVGRVAALGPALKEDPETGRATMVVQPSCFCATLEGTDAFFPRLTREAWRAGFTRGVRTVVCVADGAAWIRHQARTQFSHPEVEVVEIVDYFPAAQHLAEVAKAVYGESTPWAATWPADQKRALLQRGPAPVLNALGTFTALDEHVDDVVRRNRDYFTEHAARMDYPAFIARHFPIGSGAIESGGKVLVTQREKLSGMRWSPTGAQSIANLRALSRWTPPSLPSPRHHRQTPRSLCPRTRRPHPALPLPQPPSGLPPPASPGVTDPTFGTAALLAINVQPNARSTPQL